MRTLNVMALIAGSVVVGILAYVLVMAMFAPLPS